LHEKSPGIERFSSHFLPTGDMFVRAKDISIGLKIEEFQLVWGLSGGKLDHTHKSKREIEGWSVATVN